MFLEARFFFSGEKMNKESHGEKREKRKWEYFTEYPHPALGFFK